MSFKIHSTPATTNKSIRSANEVISYVEKLIVNKDCTFSAFVVAAVKAAIDDVKAQQKK